MNQKKEKQIYFGSKNEVKETYKLGDLLDVNSGKDYKHLDEGLIPVYGSGGLMTYVNTPISNVDSIGIGRKGTINKPYILKAPFWTVDTLFWCIPKINLYYIYNLLTTINLLKFDEGSTLPSLSSSNIKNIKVNIHNNEKKVESISTMLSSIDKLIEIKEKERGIYENLFL